MIKESELLALIQFFRDLQTYKMKKHSQYKGCDCERYHYCDACWPPELRKDGKYESDIVQTKLKEFKELTGFTPTQLFDPNWNPTARI